MAKNCKNCNASDFDVCIESKTKVMVCKYCRTKTVIEEVSTIRHSNNVVISGNGNTVISGSNNGSVVIINGKRIQ